MFLKLNSLRKILLFTTLFILPLYELQAEKVIGFLDFVNDRYEIETVNGERLKLIIDKKYQYGLSSLTKNYFDKINNQLSKEYPQKFLLFSGIKNKDQFTAISTPRVLSGAKRISGILTEQGTRYIINNKEFEFAKAYLTDGTSFNIDSINSYLGKNVSVLYKETDQGELYITALIPQVYSAKTSTNFKPQGVMKGLEKSKLERKIKSYLLKKIYTDEVSQNENTFRSTLISNKESKIKEGDTALVISLSGRQGDSPGAIAGHLAAGIATVKNDLSLDIEIWNYYDVPNNKLIIPGHNDYIDYFGNLTAGQNNYRPTYTLVMYGVDKKILLKMRDELGVDFFKMREATEEFGAFYNCATETVKALRNQGIKPKRAAKIPTHVLKKLGTAAFLPLTLLSRPFTTLGKSLEFSLYSDPARFIPRAAFDGYLKNLSKLEKKLNLKRVDYYFQKQVESDRNLGGAPSNNAWTTIKGKLAAGE